MNAKVKPDQVHKYAVMVSKNAGHYDVFGSYADTHCGKTDGLDGLLIQARPMTRVMAGKMYDIIKGTSPKLRKFSEDLGKAADDYEKTDDDNANTIVVAYKDKIPSDWKPTDVKQKPDGIENQHPNDRKSMRNAANARWHPGDFKYHNDLTLKDPTKSNEFKETIDRIKKDLGNIEKWVHKVTTISVAEDVLGKINGDWDVLRENADGWRELGHKLQQMFGNLSYGMDSVEPSWEGEGARTADHMVRGKWGTLTALLSDGCELNRRISTDLANTAKFQLDLMALVLAEAIKWIPKKVVEILKLAKGVALLAAKAAVGQLVKFVLDLKGTLEQIINLLKQIIENWKSQAGTIMDLFYFADKVLDGGYEV